MSESRTKLLATDHWIPKLLEHVTRRLLAFTLQPLRLTAPPSHVKKSSLTTYLLLTLAHPKPPTTTQRSARLTLMPFCTPEAAYHVVFPYLSEHPQTLLRCSCSSRLAWMR